MVRIPVREKKYTERMQVVFSPEDISRIERLRARESPIPTRSDIIREAVRALAVERGVEDVDG